MIYTYLDVFPVCVSDVDNLGRPAWVLEQAHTYEEIVEINEESPLAIVRLGLAVLLLELSRIFRVLLRRALITV